MRTDNKAHRNILVAAFALAVTAGILLTARMETPNKEEAIIDGTRASKNALRVACGDNTETVLSSVTYEKIINRRNNYYVIVYDIIENGDDIGEVVVWVGDKLVIAGVNLSSSEVISVKGCESV